MNQPAAIETTELSPDAVGKRRPLGRLGRMGFFGFTALLWGGVAFLALEAYTVAREWETENLNPMVALAVAGMRLPDSFNGTQGPSPADRAGAVSYAMGALIQSTRKMGLTLTPGQEAFLAEMEYEQSTPNYRETVWAIPGFEYRKNVRLTPGWSTNSLGFRGGEVTLPKPSGVFRIVCIGASTTFEGASDDTTYPKLLEKRLNEHFQGHPPVEVVNAGIEETSTGSERRRQADFLALEPDLVIEYGAPINDICFVFSYQWAEAWEREASWIQRTLVRSRTASAWTNRLFLPPQEEIRAGFDRFTFGNLRILRHAFERRGAPLALCSVASPTPAHLERRERAYFDWSFRKVWQTGWLKTNYSFDTYRFLIGMYNEHLKSFCAQEGLLYIPVAEEVQGGFELFRDVCHMWPEGIQQKADTVGRHLEDFIASRIASAPAGGK